MKLMHPDSQQVIDVDDASAWRYTSQGWRQIAPDAPRGNASLAQWQAYATSKGFTDDDIAGKTKAELRAALA